MSVNNSSTEIHKMDEDQECHGIGNTLFRTGNEPETSLISQGSNMFRIVEGSQNSRQFA